MRIMLLACGLAMLAGCAATRIVTTPVRVAAHVVKTGASAVGTAASAIP